MIHDSPFDSEHYGTTVGRAQLHATGDVDAVIAEQRARGIAVVFARADAGAPAVSELAAREIQPLETLVTSTWREGATPASGSPVTIEHLPAVDRADADAIAAITADAITISHFHADPRLPHERTRQLYADWARNDVTGRAQRTIVAREHDAILGYISVLQREATAIIDLVAVAPAHHGRGIGSALLASFVGWIRSERLAARVGTQSTNPALLLYQRFGFVPSERQVTYHLWLE